MRLILSTTSQAVHYDWLGESLSDCSRVSDVRTASNKMCLQNKDSYGMSLHSIHFSALYIADMIISPLNRCVRLLYRADSDGDLDTKQLIRDEAESCERSRA